MKHLIALSAALIVLTVRAENPSTATFPPPPTIIINYGSYQTQGQVTPVPVVPLTAVPLAEPPTVAPATVPSTTLAALEPSVLSENEPEGFTLGLLAGVLKTENGTATPSLGVAPNLRLLRFFSLEAEAVVGLATNGEKPFALSGQAVAQLTFHSVIFDLTPRIGLGYTARRTGEWNYSGTHLTLGAELGIGRLRFNAEIRAGSNKERSTVLRQTSSKYCTVLCAGDSPSYYRYGFDEAESHSYQEGRLGFAYQIGEKSRAGFLYSASPNSTHGTFIYQFSF